MEIRGVDLSLSFNRNVVVRIKFNLRFIIFCVSVKDVPRVVFCNTRCTRYAVVDEELPISEAS